MNDKKHNRAIATLIGFGLSSVVWLACGSQLSEGYRVVRNIIVDAASGTPVNVTTGGELRVLGEDFLQEVMEGKVSGYSMVHKFGRSDSVPNGSWSHISMTPFSIAEFRQSASTMRIAAGNAADTAAGAGARSVTIQGIDNALNEYSETLVTSGGVASASTTGLYWRVHRAWVASAGAYTVANTGDCVVEDTGGGTNYLTIVAGEGQSQYAGWTVPEGKSALLLSVHVTVDSNKKANIRCMTRKTFNDVSAPMPSVRMKLHWDGVEGSFVYKPYGPELNLTELTDIWFEGFGDGAVSHISVDFELLCYDN